MKGIQIRKEEIKLSLFADCLYWKFQVIDKTKTENKKTTS